MTARITPRPQHGDVVIERDDQPTVLVVVRHRTGAPDAAGEALDLARRIARLPELEAVAEAARDVVRMEGYETGRRVRHAGNVLADEFDALDAAEADHGR